MATIKFRLCEADRERWSGPEWTVYDDEPFLKLDYDALAALEKDMLAEDGLSLVKLIVVEWPRRSLLGIRGMVWITRQLGGLAEPKWRDFKPDCLLVDVERVEGDAVPLPDGSSLPPSESAETGKPAASKKG
jgi:hypothetical protein